MSAAPAWAPFSCSSGVAIANATGVRRWPWELSLPCVPCVSCRPCANFSFAASCAHDRSLQMALFHVPHVQEIRIGGGSHFLSRLVGGTIQRRAHLLLAVPQFLQWDLERGIGFQALQIGEDLVHQLIVLALAASRD